MTYPSETYCAEYVDLCAAWHAIASEYETSNVDDPCSLPRLRTDVAFTRLLVVSGWSVEEWNAQVAGEK